jgi:predicted esterase YcpF (UPF0227 family)
MGQLMGQLMGKTKLIYLHGFNSSPDSYKARVLSEHLRRKLAVDENSLKLLLEIPEIPPAPVDAAEMLVRCVEAAQKKHTVALAGSSLGGFYATWLAEMYGTRAVLINPAVRPYDLLGKYLGENINYYTSERWMLDATHIEQLRDLEVDPITRPDRYLLMVQTGDETLDYRLAVEKYSGCTSIIEEGGNHSFVAFENHIDRILDFCDVK